MSWNSLQIVLQAMPATGPNGFEGVIAAVLEKLLGEPFIVARSGDQSGMDARNSYGGSVMQAKRYSAASLTEARVETDFHNSRRELEQLEVYVLAVTKSTAQLQTRLDQLRDETGIDLIALDWQLPIPALGALCLVYWPHISHFARLRDLGQGFALWATEQAALPEVQQRVQQLRRDIAEQLASFETVRRNARHFLARRFDYTQPPFPREKIQLRNAVHRTAVDSVWQWWQSSSSIARLQGKEGMGKSWTAAEFGWRAANEAQALVFWLESVDWQECRTVDDILGIALRQLGVRDEQVKRRLIRKALRRWAPRLLFVLDGVNENNALPAAQSLIMDLLTISASRFKLIFTCRSLNHQRAYSPTPWESTWMVEAGPFNDVEFSAALDQLTPSLRIADVPPGLQELARIPRYFETCMRLRDRLGGLEVVTREMVLWADLIDRIELRGDAQARQRLGWTAEQDAAEILKALARNAIFAGERATAALDLLNRCFQGRYEDVRRDLEELRIAESTLPQSAELSMDHVVLGCGLYLQETACSHQGTVGESKEQILRALEPLANADSRTESVFVALQLTALRGFAQGETLVRARAALLAAWVSLQNHVDSRPRLLFWAETDVEAYSEFLQVFFECLDRGHAQTEVVAPLAHVWRAPKEKGTALRLRIESWLLLVWTPENRPADEALEHRGHRLPLAGSEAQVGLSSVAVSLISLRPEPEMLPALALCRATLDLSCIVRLFPRQNAPQQTEEFRMPVKRLENAIGTVMRWCYTEAVLSELEKLARASAADELMVEGIRLLAKSLRLVTLPDALQIPEPTQPFLRHGVPATQLIREQRTLFPRDYEQGYPAEGDFRHLSIRDDLPDLLISDRNLIRSTVEDICARFLPHRNRGMTSEDSQFDRWWPWYAKYFPQELNRLVGALRMAALRADQPLYTLLELRWGLRDASQVADRELREQLQATALRFQTEEGRTPHHVLLQIFPLALLELSDNENELLAWLEFAAMHRPSRWAIDFHPTCLVLPFVIPPRVASLAFERCVALADEAPESAATSATEFDYWCSIAGKTIPASIERYEWVKHQIKSRNPQGDRRFHWLMLLFATAPSEELAQDFAHGLWPDIFHGMGFRALSVTSHRLGNLAPPSCSYENLMRWLPRDFVGGVLFDSGRHEDAQRWGKELLAYALAQVGRDVFSRRFQGVNTYTLDREGQVNGRGFTEPPRTLTSVQGIHTQIAEENLGEAEEIWKRAHELWLEDNARLDSWAGGDLHSFSGSRALKSWRKLHPKEFLSFANLFLDRVLGQARFPFHLNCFIDAVLCNLVALAPQDALQWCERMHKAPFEVSTYYDISCFTAALWDTTDCRLLEHSTLRYRLFQDAQDEGQIMALTIAAQAEGGTEELWRLVEDELLVSRFARERALAASIIAWVGDDRAVSTLDRLAAADASDWVREHAGWCAEVARGEHSARRFYRQILREPDPRAVSARLEVLRAALTPTARWWHYRVEESEPGYQKTGRAAAVIDAFWDSWSNSRPSSVTIYGRGLGEHCRGEQLDSPRPPKLAPWWKP